MRDQLYGTLEQVCEGERYLIPTKNGEVMLIQKAEYDLLVDDLELLKEFEDPIQVDRLIDQDVLWKKMEKRFGFTRENPLDKKSRKQPK